MAIIVLNENCFLDFLQDNHAGALFNLVNINRDYLRQWLNWVDACQCENDSLNFIRNTQKEWDERTALTLGLWYHQQLVGVVSFHTINQEHKTASIGYWLSETHQGKGLATLACKELINYGFEYLDLNNIEISCAVENHKSQAIPKRLGFWFQKTVESKERLYETLVDHDVYIVNRKQWYEQCQRPNHNLT